MEKIGPTQMTQTLGKVWKSAGEALADCEALVVAGYSFPPNDKQFQLLLRTALEEARDLRGITIISNPKFGDERLAFENRNAAVFSSSRLQRLLEFKFVPFEDWVSAGGHQFVL